MILPICTQAATAPATARAAEFAELKRQLDVADDDITLVNKWLDEAQGMSFGRSMSINRSMMLEFIICLTADGAAAVETLRAELAWAKEQARISNAAVEKAVGELKAEQAAHRLSEEKISNMALELRDAASQYALLEKETKEKVADLEKVLQASKETRSEARTAWEEIRQAGEIAAGKPFLLRTKFGDPKYALLDQMWSFADAYLDL